MVRERRSKQFAGQGAFAVSANGRGFMIWFHPETKEAARKVAEEWLAANASAR